MPILDVQIIGDVEVPPKEIARAIADRAGEILGARVGGTWVRLHFLPVDHYAESGGAPAGIQPVFVSVLTGSSVEMSDRAHVADNLAGLVAKIVVRPRENIHILFEPEAAGRIAFGGKLIAG